MDGRKPIYNGTVILIDGRPYRIERLMGRGANAMVYMASYPDALLSGKTHFVIIKELFPYQKDGLIFRDGEGRICRDGSAEETFILHRESFLRGNAAHLELQSSFAARGNTNLNSHEAYNTLYTVLDYQGGETLAQLIERGGISSLCDAVRAISLLLDALEPFHALGMLHMDISPDNILILPSNKEALGRAVLFDYNSTWSMEELTDRKGLYYSVKEPYSAPEIRLKSCAEVSGASDLFSVCVIFAELLKGGSLSFAELSGSSVGRLFDIEGSLLRDKAQTVVHKTVSILRRGLRLSPKQRFQSIGELRAELDELTSRMDGFGVTHGALWEASAEAFRRTEQSRKESVQSADDYIETVLTEQGAPNAAITVTGGERGMDGLMDALTGWNRTGSRHAMLTGAGGRGKTLLLTRIRHELSCGYSPTRPAAIYISLADYDGRPSFLCDSILKQLRFSADNAHYADAVQGLFELLSRPLEPVGTPAVMLLLDGFNALSLPPEPLMRELGSFCALSGVQVIGASREWDGALITRCLELEVPSPREMERYAGAHGARLPDGDAGRAMLSNPMLLSLYVRSAEFGGTPESASSPAAILDSYLNSLLKAWSYAHPGADASQVDFALFTLLPLLALETGADGVRIPAQRLLACVERVYRRLGTRTFSKLYPRYIGKSELIRGDAKSADAWFEDIASTLLQKRFALIVRESDDSYRFSQGMYAELLRPSGLMQQKLLRTRTLKEWLLRAAPILLAAALLCVFAVKVIAPSLPYPHTQAQRQATGRAMTALMCSMSAMDSFLNKQYELIDLAQSGTNAATAEWELRAERYIDELEAEPLNYMLETDDMLNELSRRAAPVSTVDFRAVLLEPSIYRETALTQTRCLMRFLNAGSGRDAKARNEALTLLTNLLDYQRDAFYARAVSIMNCFSGEEREDMLEAGLVYLPVFGEVFMEQGVGIRTDELVAYSDHHAQLTVAELKELGFYIGEEG